MRFLSTAILSIVALGWGQAFAAPVTIDVTPTFSAPSGVVEGYRAYQGCNLSGQTKGALIGPASSGQVFSFQGDSSQSYVVCVVAYNSTGEGGFTSVGNIGITLAPPGDTDTTYTCTLNPASGGTCTVN